MNFPTLKFFDIVPPMFLVRHALSATLIFVLLVTPLFGALVVLSASEFRQTMSVDIGPCSALIAIKRDLPPLRANDTLVAGGWCAATAHFAVLRDSP